MEEISQNSEHMKQTLSTAEVNRRGIRAYTFFGMGILAFVVMMSILPQAIAPLIYDNYPDFFSKYGLLVNYICMYIVGFPLLLIVIRNVHTATPIQQGMIPKKMKPWAFVGLFFICDATMSGLAILVNVVETSFIGKSGTVSTLDLSQSATPQWLMFLCGVIIAPIMEEVIFRHLAYKKLAGYGAKLFIVWTAVMFGLMHLNLGQTIYATALGLILAKIAYDTGTAKYTILLHVLINFKGGIGIGSMIFRAGNENLIIMYGLLNIFTILIGIICAIIFLVKFRGQLKSAPVQTLLENKKRAFLNAGTLLYVGYCIFKIVWIFVA